MSVFIISTKTLPLNNTYDVYKLNYNTFQLPEHVIPLDILHKVNNKTPQYLNIPILNTDNSFCSISRCSHLATLVPTEKCGAIRKLAGTMYIVIMQSYCQKYWWVPACNWNLTLNLL